MKISYILLFTVLFFSTSCVNDYSEGTKHEDQISHSYNTDSSSKDVASIGEDIEKVIQDREAPDRKQWQKPQKVVQKLGNVSGKVVADIGAGHGFFTIHFLPKAEKVIAIDIDTSAIAFLEDLKTRLKDNLKEKMETRLVDTDDPKLLPNEVDIIFMSNTYSYIENKVDYLKAASKGLKPGGRICIVDHKMKKLPSGPKVTRVPLFIVEQQMEEAGLNHLSSDDQLLPYQYIVIAEKK